MRNKIVTLITTLAFVLGFSLQAASEPGDEDSFKYRQSIMTALKGHAGALSMQTRGLAGEPRHAAKHASAIASLGAELRSVFPEGSKVHDSEALAAIWEKPDEFAAAIAVIEEAAAALGEIADGGDMTAIGAAFRNVGKACKGCHDDFRAEQ